jgi:D-ornithine 4,5-aminomutase subunit beta
MRLDLPYAVALRELFREYKMRAQQNTKYMTSSAREATVTHTLNLLISELTSADIQSTITPDEGRNVPWHIYNVEGSDTAKQAFNGMDGLTEMVSLRRSEGPLAEKARELKERAVLFLEEMLETGGYFQAVEQGFFVDSGLYPERNGDGIVRTMDGGVSADSVYERDEDYMAPVTGHFGYNNLAQYGPEAEKDPASLIGGCTFEKPEKIVYVDELDQEDNVHRRMAETAELRRSSKVKPEMEWQGDGIVMLNLFLPLERRTAEFTAVEIARRMGLEEAEVIHSEVMQPAEGTRIELKGKFNQIIDTAELDIPPAPKVLSEDEIREEVKKRPMKVVAGTVGEDEHSVGLREILDIKHGGLEGFGIQCHYLGTSVPLEKLVDAAIETEADAILASTIISHYDVHYRHMKRLHELCVEKGIRDRIILIAGGTQVSPEIAREQGVDRGFGRGTQGIHVATFLVERRRELRGEK